MPETTLDLRGLRCPLPALKTRKALTRLAAGDRLVVECTDPGHEVFTTEYARAAELGLTSQQLLQLAEESFNAAFLPPLVRATSSPARVSRLS